MKTKNLLLIAFAATVLFACNSGNHTEYIVKGHIEGNPPEEVYLQKSKDGRFEILDTAKVENGNFVFKGEITVPDLYFIALNEQLYIPFFNEAANIKIDFHTDSLMTPSVSGSVSDKEYRQYLEVQKEQRTALRELFTLYREAEGRNDEDAMSVIEAQIDIMQDKQFADMMDYIKKNSKSFVAPYIAMRESYGMELPDMEEIAASFDESVKKSPFAEMFTERIDLLQNVAIGKTAPDFTMNNTEGEPVSLSQLRGKILLVDFWAAWCGPCRAENPNVVKAYNRFNDKGFDVLGVSLDRDRDAWLKAIEDDNLTWTQLSDLQFWQNAAAKLYGVNSIPSNVLLDRDGVIIGRNLRGEDLQKKLEELFTEN